MKHISLLVCMLFAHAVSAEQDIRRSALAGRAVDFAVVDTAVLSPQPWPGANLLLSQKTVSVNSETNIYLLLQANGVAPDSESFAIVYDLNPHLVELTTPIPSASIVIPCVADEAALRALLKEHRLIELTVDPEIRLQLNQHADALGSLSASVDRVTDDPEFRNKIQSVIKWYGQIESRFKRRTGPPLRRASLIELRDEANAFLFILNGALSAKRPLSVSEQAQLMAIYEDVQLEMTQYSQTLASTAPRAQGSYVVTVNIAGIDSKRAQSLRIYYTYNGLFRPLPAQPPIESFGFARLGSGASENLLMKNYRFWGAKDGDANHPLTPPYLLQIDRTSPASLSVDLSLKTPALP
jgi:hypothetical protein